MKLRAKEMILIASLASLLVGCIGPHGLRATRQRYSKAIQQTNEEQILLSLVHNRYQDGTAWLSVGTITAQFETRAAADYSGGTDRDLPTQLWKPGIGVSDRPTIVYSPASEDFFSLISQPLEIEQLQSISRIHPLKSVLRLFLSSVNGLDNASSAEIAVPQSPPQVTEFRQFADLVGVLRSQNAIAVQRRQRATGTEYVLPLKTVDDVLKLTEKGFEVRANPDSSDLYSVREVTKSTVFKLRIGPDTVQPVADLQYLLGLETSLTEYELERSPVQLQMVEPTSQLSKIKVTPRSLNQAAHFVSKGIEVPSEHVQCGLVPMTRYPDGTLFDWNCVLDDLFRVCCCKHRPRNARVAVKYRGYWFYIADGDIASITTLRMLERALNLQGAKSAGKDVDAPVLTISAGG